MYMTGYTTSAGESVKKNTVFKGSSKEEDIKTA